MNINKFNKTNELRKTFLPLAIEAIRQEFLKALTVRVKLTHAWLAKELGITNGLAFPLLVQVARVTEYCVNTPSGVILWSDQPLSEEEKIKYDTPREIANLRILDIIADAALMKILGKNKIAIHDDYGYVNVEVGSNFSGKIQISGNHLRISATRNKFEHILSLVDGIWTKRNEKASYSYTTVANWKVR